eukprot:GHVU01205166.1.p1 GENE.GHVU01205166.1~~GHVU01205166.1.p1  ORF type:complete len:138 (-),score=10.43 GHVU01205166.1:438-851(-)
MNPFDHIKNLHTKKRTWDDFNDEEKKSFNVFIINKGLSMNPNYLGIVNMVQNFTGLNQILSPKEVFKLYYNLLPNKFRFYKWIKGEKSKKDKEKAEYLAMHFKVSTREAYDYLDILDKKTINSILKNYKNEPQRKAI